MSVADVYIRFKAFLVDTARAGLTRLMNLTTKTMQGAARMMAPLGTMLGEMGGKLGQLSTQLLGVWDGIQKLGAIGGMMAGAQIAITMWANRAKEAVEDFKQAVDRLAERVKKRGEEIERVRMEKLAASLREATTLADRAAKAFDTMAAAYLKVQGARSSTEAAKADAGIAALELAKSTAMGGADGNGRAIVGAKYDLDIALARQKRSVQANAEAVERATQEQKDAAERSRMATRRHRAAAKAVADAEEELALTKKVEGDNAKKVADYQSRLEAARAALDAANNEQTTRRADLEAANEKLAQARLKAAADAARSAASVSTAKTTLADLELAKRREDAAEKERRRAEDEQKRAKESARIEAERLAAERAVAAQRRAQADDLRAQRTAQNHLAASFQSALSEARSDLANAWRLYRDKDAMKAVMDEEKAQKEAEKAWEKDFARLRRRRDWRTAENLSVDDRATREVALAKEREANAERRLAEIAENTARLDEKIEQLVGMKEGG